MIPAGPVTGERRAAARRPRVAVVFGAGGVLGAAWMTGALPALQERLPCPLGEADVLVGTSAGSVLAAALRCRVTIGEMIAYQRGEPTGVLAGCAADGLTAGPWPPPPQLRAGSPRLMLASVLAPHRIHPCVGASAWLPRGRASHLPLRRMVQLLEAHAGPAGLGREWPGQGQTWIVAVDYGTGRRVCFGRAGAPRAQLADAVAASCSIPGWYRPVIIGGRRYVDGGIRSATSLGVLASAGVAEAHVLAPMASLAPGRPRTAAERLERHLRRLITIAVLRETRALRSAGVRVWLHTPGPGDLAAMGANLMDPRRRRAVLETSLHTSAGAGREAAQAGAA